MVRISEFGALCKRNAAFATCSASKPRGWLAYSLPVAHGSLDGPTGRAPARAWGGCPQRRPKSVWDHIGGSYLAGRPDVEVRSQTVSASKEGFSDELVNTDAAGPNHPVRGCRCCRPESNGHSMNSRDGQTRPSLNTARRGNRTSSSAGPRNEACLHVRTDLIYPPPTEYAEVGIAKERCHQSSANASMAFCRSIRAWAHAPMLKT